MVGGDRFFARQRRLISKSSPIVSTTTGTISLLQLHHIHFMYWAFSFLCTGIAHRVSVDKFMMTFMFTSSGSMTLVFIGMVVVVHQMAHIG